MKSIRNLLKTVYEQEDELTDIIGNQKKSEGFRLYGGCLELVWAAGLAVLPCFGCLESLGIPSLG